MNLPGLAVKRRVTFLMVFVLMAGTGVFGASRLGLNYLPNIDIGQIVIVTILPGAGPEEVENLVTEVIEDAVSGIEGVTTVESRSSSSTSGITLSLSNSADIDETEDEVKEAVDAVEDQLPDQARQPLVTVLESSMRPVVYSAFVSDVLNGSELRRLMEDEIAPVLSRTEGVASVRVDGGRRRQINVRINSARLLTTGITLGQIYEAVAGVTGNQPGGSLKDGYLEIAISLDTGFDDLEELRQLVVGKKGNHPVRLCEVATVEDGFEDTQHLTHLDQGTAILCTFRKSPDANTVNTCSAISEALRETADSYAGVLDVQVLYNQKDYVINSMQGLLWTALQAVVLAALVLLLFLGSYSNSGIVSLSMPLVLLSSFGAIYLMGLDLDLLTLAGLAISVGMIVDNSIVVLENIHRRRKTGEEAIPAARNGATQVGLAVAASTLTTISVFVPLLFVPGITGDVFRGLSLTISSALLISLFISQTMVPLIGSQSRKLVVRHGRLSPLGRIQKLLDRLESRYAAMVGRVVEHPVAVLLPVTVVFALSMLALSAVPKSFLPELEEGVIEINLSLAPGSRVELTDSVTSAVERKLIDVLEPEDFRHSYLDVGKASGIGAVFGADASSRSQIILYLREPEHLSVGTEEYVSRIREVLDAEPGVSYSIYSALSVTTEAPIEVTVFGQDIASLRRAGELLRHQLSGIEGITDVESSLEDLDVQLEFEPSKEVLALRGASPARVGGEVTIGVQGLEASTFRDRGTDVDVNVRLAEGYRSSREQLAAVPVLGRPLDAWGTIEDEVIPRGIEHRDRSRSVTVSCYIEDRALGDVAGEVKSVLDTLSLEGNRYQIGGDVEKQEESFRHMTIAIAIAVCLVYMVMASQFESLVHPFLLLFEIPFALTGVVWILLATGTTMGMTSLVGVLMLVGIVVNNGIVMVDFTNQIRRDRRSGARKAIVEAARARMRPILMTAFTTSLALTPLALGQGATAVLWAPMALTVIGGIVVATPLTLVVLPVMYVAFDRLTRSNQGR
ncbi:hypothetical protein GF402_01630 [Candidatus Fermentibacteria bacterium]|nr:hypothetical protein [Candidatus Fermentibacteria bacterium]